MSSSPPTVVDLAPAAPEVDEFDLDLRIGQALPLWSRVSTLLLDAQTDGAGCIPTGGGGTCNTGNPTCPNTCDDATCPNTCPNTCQNTCPNTCRNTCPNTCRNTCPNTCQNTCQNTCRNTCGHGATCAGATCAATCNNTHCFTCRSGCQTP